MQPEYVQTIRSFYEETLWIVANFWTNRKVLATHVGYWESYTHTVGFTAIRLDDESARVRPSIDRLHRHPRWSAPIFSGLSHIGLLSPVVARAMWANEDFYELTRRGLTNYGIFSAVKP